MTSSLLARPDATEDRAPRLVEWWGAWLALVLQSSVLFPLLLADPDGGLDDRARSMLRLVSLAASAIAAGLLARHLRPALRLAAQNSPLLALLLLPFASVTWSISPSSSGKAAVGLALGMLVPLLIAVRFTPRQALILVGGALGTGMALSLALAVAMPGLAFMPGGSELRGIYPNKNVLGWAAGLCTLVGATMRLDGSRAVARQGACQGARQEARQGARLGTPLLLAGLACLLLSKSATGILSVGAGLLLVVAYEAAARCHGLARGVVVLVILQVIALVLIFLGTLLVPMLEALGKDATLTGRVPLWALVDREIARRPLLGYGYEAFWTDGSAGAWSIWSQLGWQAPHSHNGYRETALRFGVVGLVPMAVLVLRTVWQGVRLHLARPDEGWMWLNVMVGAFLFMNLTESMILDAGAFPWVVFATASLMFAKRSRELRPVRQGLPHLTAGPFTHPARVAPGCR